MNKNQKQKPKRIELRVSEADKKKIKRLADKCSLSISEYMLLRALGYEPKTTPPDAFFDFYKQLCRLCNAPISSEAEAKLLSLIEEIHTEYILPSNEQNAGNESEIYSR